MPASGVLLALDSWHVWVCHCGLMLFACIATVCDSGGVMSGGILCGHCDALLPVVCPLWHWLIALLLGIGRSLRW